jgi:hypothetical protein
LEALTPRELRVKQGDLRGGIPPGDCKAGFLSKMYLTSFVGTDMVFKDGRYLVVHDVTKLNQIA